MDPDGWPYYLENLDPVPPNGHTALRTSAGPNARYLIANYIREYVTRGGDVVGPGSVIARLNDGIWITERIF